MKVSGVLAAVIAGITLAASVAAEDPNTSGPKELETADGYRGIWYMNQPSKDEYRYKYSGGFATYPQQHIPIAFYSKEADKTFFCYGGTVEGKQELLHMVSYFDHTTGKVPRPRVLLNKQTSDAHDNPTLMLDDPGHIWIFSNSHGGGRPSFIHRSVKPYSIDAFDRVTSTSFSYSQPWFVPGKGFLFLHTRYEKGGRSLYWKTSRDGIEWGDAQQLARMDLGHYQVSWREGDRVATAFNFHPQPQGLNARTNLFYAETRDMGNTWKSVDGTTLKPPLTTTQTAALVHDYHREGLLVYLKDVQFESDGHPVLLFLTSRGFESGPKNDPRTWRTARWTGSAWEIRDFAVSDNNYDFGSLYIEDDGAWRIIGPTETGPQPYNTGGEVAMWLSRDQGANWQKLKQLTRGSTRNHTYVRRPVNAHPDFDALWADGDARQESGSDLFFTNRDGSHVWRLPAKMDADFAQPEVAW
jgi:hypothetical protein